MMASSPPVQDARRCTSYAWRDVQCVECKDARMWVTLEVQSSLTRHVGTPYGTIQDTHWDCPRRERIRFDLAGGGGGDGDGDGAALSRRLERDVPAGIAAAFSKMEVSMDAQSKTALESQLAGFVLAEALLHREYCGLDHGFALLLRVEERKVMSFDVGRDEVFRFLREYGVYDGSCGALCPEEETSTCPICLNELLQLLPPGGHEDICRTGCGHLYHTGCILHWLCQKRSCPLCRSPLPPPS